MRFCRIAVLASLVVLSGAPAMAQFGLYGSPEMLNLSQANPAIVPYDGYTVPVAYPVQLVVSGRYVGGPLEPLSPEPVLLAQASQSAAVAEGPGAVDAMLSNVAYVDDPACCGETACGECGRCGGCGCDDRSCCPWYGLAYALLMGRSNANRVWTSYNWEDESDQEEHTAFGLEWRWGGEIRIGRRFCCGTRALEFTYWTLEAFEGSRTTSLPGGVATPLIVGHLSFGGNSASEWFDGALEHRLWRRNEFHNFEVNFLRQRILRNYGLPWDFNVSCGVRYFRFQEHLIFSATANPAEMTNPAQNREAFLDEDITNELLGVQVGFDLNYRVRPGLRAFLEPKVGIYNNHIEHIFQAYLGDGTVGTQTMYPGMTYPVSSETDVVAFLTQIDLGLEWQLSQKLSARLGYRAIVAAGLGLADDQIPPYIVDMPEIAAIDTAGEMVLHGAFFGVAYDY